MFLFTRPAWFRVPCRLGEVSAVCCRKCVVLRNYHRLLRVSNLHATSRAVRVVGNLLRTILETSKVPRDLAQDGQMTDLVRVSVGVGRSCFGHDQQGGDKAYHDHPYAEDVGGTDTRFVVDGIGRSTEHFNERCAHHHR